MSDLLIDQNFLYEPVVGHAIDGLGVSSDGPNGPRERVRNEIEDVLAAMISRVAPTLMVNPANAQPKQKDTSNDNQRPTEVRALLEELDGRKTVPAAPELRHIAGGFFACVLLFEGWWNRPPEEETSAEPEKRQDNPVPPYRNIQAWLNRGFEQWGPSWSLDMPAQKSAVLYGQLGSGDEANSIPVMVAPEKAGEIRGEMGNALVKRVSLRGLLCHRSHIETHFVGETQMAMRRLAEAHAKLDYFIVVQDGEEHCIKPSGKLNLYSAYIWQCLVRKEHEERARRGDIPTAETIFLWEHTNLASFDSIKFNFEALEHKKHRLETLMASPLVVLQQSYPVHTIVGAAPTVPLVSTATMREVFSRLSHTLADDGPG